MVLKKPNLTQPSDTVTQQHPFYAHYTAKPMLAGTRN